MKSNLPKLLAALSILAITIIAAISWSQPNENSAPAEIQQAILDRMAEIQNAAQALDPDKVFSYVTENDKGALIQNGKLNLTRKEALESTRQGFEGLQKVNYQFDRHYVTLLAPTVALAVSDGVSTATIKDGRTFTNRFAQSVVFILTDGEWKVFHSHRSFLPAK
jgi:ketosteroid isomerase-like protein